MANNHLAVLCNVAASRCRSCFLSAFFVSRHRKCHPVVRLRLGGRDSSRDRAGVHLLTSRPAANHLQTCSLSARQRNQAHGQRLHVFHLCKPAGGFTHNYLTWTDHSIPPDTCPPCYCSRADQIYCSLIDYSSSRGNSAEFSTEQTGSHAVKQQYNLLTLPFKIKHSSSSANPLFSNASCSYNCGHEGLFDAGTPRFRDGRCRQYCAVADSKSRTGAVKQRTCIPVESRDNGVDHTGSMISDQWFMNRSFPSKHTDLFVLLLGSLVLQKRSLLHL